MSKEADLIGLKARFFSVRDLVLTLLARYAPASAIQIGLRLDATMTQADKARIAALIQNYRSAVNSFPYVVRGLSIFLEHVDSDSAVNEPAKALEIMRVNCDVAIAIIDSQLRPVTPQEADRLRSLRDQIKDIEGRNQNMYKHLEQGIREFEEGHHLSCALVAGKLIDFSLDQLPGRNDEEKAELLVQNALLDRKLKTGFLKAARKARNFFSHELDAVPEPQESLELLASAVNISLLLFKTERTEGERGK